MYVITIDAPIDTFAYGPFMEPEAARTWGERIGPMLPSTNHWVRFFEVSAPFDITGELPVLARSAAPAVHCGRASDGQAAGFVVRLSEDDVAEVVGPFGVRDGATEWWDTQRPALGHGVCAEVLPIVAPHDPH